MAYNIFDFSHFWYNLKTLLNNKVDKVSGMGLSQNSFTNAEKTKLANTYIKSEVDTALAEKLNTSDVDVALSSTSTNPVQNKVVKSALDSKADATDIPTVPITAIQKNGTGITPVSGTVNITVPTTAADISALPDTTKYAVALSLTINSSTFVITCQLKDQNGDDLGTAQTIDLPLESVVVGGAYDIQTKKVVLTLQNGNIIEFSVADLVSGLQTELSASNKLNPAYINYDSTHRAVSDTEKSTWNNKQDPLTTAQLAAVNSGITAEKLETIDTALSDKVDKVTGKGLSTNDFTDTDKTNLTTAFEKANTAAPQATTYTKDEVDTAIEEAIEHGGGGTTDYTELTNKPSINGVVLTGNKTTSDLGIEENVQADWDEADTTAPSYIKNKPNIPSGVVVDTTYDGTSENAQAGTAVAQAISTKVDKVTGKGLSTNDFTNAEKTKLDGIESGAEANVQADWTQTDTTADDYIKNKPTIPSPVTVDQTYSAASANAQSGVAVAQAISTKVDKVTGKGLSTNDFTNTDKANLATALTKANAAAPQATTYTKTEVDTALAEKLSHELTVPPNSIFEYANSLPVGFYTARQGYGTGSDKPVANEGYTYLISIFTSSTAQITAFTAIKEAAIAAPNIYTAVKSNGTWGSWYKFEGTAVT